MSYFSAATHVALKADPGSIVGYFNAAGFSADLGPVNSPGWMDGAMLRAAFCSVIANDMFPYGPFSSNLQLANLMACPNMSCAQFVAVTLHFMKFFPECDGLEVYACGWDNSVISGAPVSPIGNHVQMIVKGAAGSMLLDPTIGLVLRAQLSDLAQGRSYNFAANSRIFCRTFQPQQIKLDFANTVENAFTNGLLQHDHHLYTYRTLAGFVAQQAIEYRATFSGARAQT